MNTLAPAAATAEALRAIMRSFEFNAAAAAQSARAIRPGAPRARTTAPAKSRPPKS